LTASPKLAILTIAMSYPGGKNAGGVYHAIINQMPPHDVYIEPFLGSGAVLRLKKPASCSIAIDRDDDVVAAALAEFGESRSITVISGDGIRFLQERRWSTRELVYCDPPYLMSTRRIQNRPIYRWEMTEQDHIELLGTLKTIPAMVLISGYDSPLYRSMLERWRLVTFQAMTRGGTPATECLWMNFPEPTALHDYRFIGRDFRERERIKRRVRRWEGKLRKMNPIERIALSGAIAQVADSGSAIAGSSEDAGGIVNFSDGSRLSSPPGRIAKSSEGSS
jgi:hypothetical protein